MKNAVIIIGLAVGLAVLFLLYNFYLNKGPTKEVRITPARVEKKTLGEISPPEAVSIYAKEGPSAESIEDRVSMAALEKIPVVNVILKSIESASAAFALRMALGITDYVKRMDLNVGDAVRIEKSDKFISEFARERINDILKNIPIEVEQSSVHFEKENVLRVKYIIKVGGLTYEGHLIGRMVLERTPRKWLRYEVEEFKIGNNNLPVRMVNRLLIKSYKSFNENMPLDIEVFEIDGQTGKFICEGFLREKMRLKDIEQPGTYERRLEGTLKGKI